MSVLFVAGTGTDVGKTYVVERLIETLRADGRRVLALKPVASGVPARDDPTFLRSDTARLLRAQGLPVNHETVAACSPWRFSAALSPDAAARAEGRSLALSDIVGVLRAAVAKTSHEVPIVIEGVGGVMSPICDDAVNLDLIAAMSCPTLLVAGSYLGAISHALTALEVLKARMAYVAALLVNESQRPGPDPATTMASIRRFAPGLEIGLLRRGDACFPKPVLQALAGANPTPKAE